MKALSLPSLIKRMKKCKPGVQCGVMFNDDETVTLHWNLPDSTYEITLKQHQISVESPVFQRSMMLAEREMKES